MNIDLEEVGKSEALTDRDKLTLKYIIEDGMTKLEAAQKAGFAGQSKSALINAANKVMRKWEKIASSLDILKAHGISESKLAEVLSDILEKGTNAEKLKAVDIAAKCLGLYQGTVALGGAIIQINTSSKRTPDFTDGTTMDAEVVVGESIKIVE